MVAGKVQLYLALLQLGLLEGKDVRANRVEDLGEARRLLEHGAQAVDVPRNKAQAAGGVCHDGSLFFNARGA